MHETKPPREIDILESARQKNKFIPPR